MANWMLDHRLFTVALIIVPTLALAYKLQTIEVYSRFADLLPAKHEYIKNYNRMKATFGGATIATLGDFAGVFQKWTTGRVVHTDMGGNY
ncbi:MAG: hypothetical protein ACU85V_18600, partial [Gammaproteobacteria bacterium]